MVSLPSAGIGFIDGVYSPVSELRLPISDLGFQLSDLCYDALQVWDGGFFRLDDHLDRFEQSVAARRYDTLDFDREGVADVLHRCVAQASLDRAMVTLIATRGSPTTPQKDLRTCKNRLIVWALPYYRIVSESELTEGCDVIIAETTRISPDSVDPTVKNFARLDFVSAMFEAYERDANYALLLDEHGHVTEGRGWNIFGLRDGELFSPEQGVLEGITRRTIFELSEELNIEARLRPVEPHELKDAEEVFMTSSAGGIMPVKRIDEVSIGDGTPGPVTTRLSELYWALHQDPAYRTPVRYDVD